MNAQATAEPKTKERAEAKTEAKTESKRIRRDSLEPFGSVKELQSGVAHAMADEFDGPSMRTWSASAGFRSAHALQTADPHVLGHMAACISFALSIQAQNGSEEAAEVIGTLQEYIAESGDQARHSARMGTLLVAAQSLGYVESTLSKETPLDEIELPDQAKIIMAFLADQKKAKVDDDFQNWIKATANGDK